MTSAEQAKKLGDALLAAKVLNIQQLRKANEATTQGKAPSLVIALLDLGFLTFKTFEKFLSKSTGIHSAIVANRPPVKEIVDKIGLDTLASRYIYPFAVREGKDGKKNLALGMVDPLDSDVIKFVESKTGNKVIPVLISLPDYRDAMRKHLPPSQIDIKVQRDDFVLVRQGGYEEEIKMQTSTNQGEGTDQFRDTRTVQPKPGFQKTMVLTQVNHKLHAELLGPNVKKFREEILAKLDLEPSDVKYLSEPSYTRDILYSHLALVSPQTLQKIYNTMSADLKVEALVNALIKAGYLSKVDMLISAAVSYIFSSSEEMK